MKGVVGNMSKNLSISFTLGKASQPNKVNLKHNNRDFIAKNIDIKKTHENITFVSENIEDAYHKSLLRDADIERYADEIPSGLDDEIMSL